MKKLLNLNGVQKIVVSVFSAIILGIISYFILDEMVYGKPDNEELMGMGIPYFILIGIFNIWLYKRR